MALSDLDTSGIGWIGFYNHLDNGASDIDPFSAKSALDNVTEYSNGIEGQIEISDENDYRAKTGTVWNVRVKSDGWVIAWLPASRPDVELMPWLQSQAYSNSEMRLWQVVEQAHQALDTNSDVNFSRSDVSVHHYQFDGATTVDIANSQGDGTYWTIEATDDTTIYGSSAGCGRTNVYLDRSGSNYLLDRGEMRDMADYGYISSGSKVEIEMDGGCVTTVTTWG